ncbi:MAG: hypothetical protein EOO77_34090 [Oxalobacteraceae bacterium]|nr:MAG: hypothetical protein EOO77_34090 [Oxalobacteraceae bacterium]
MHEAIFWRGVFIHRYAGMEHTLSELLLRLGAHEAYKGFGELPYPWAKKLSRLSAILDAPGPVRDYADWMRRALTPLTSAERQRHLLVHGMMSLGLRREEPRTLFFKTHDWIKGDLGEITMWITIDDLRGMTDEVGEHVRDFVRGVAELFEKLDLAPIAVSDLEALDTAARKI